jgi:16S rRNA (cytosine967-C5)-methyltransferase
LVYHLKSFFAAEKKFGSTDRRTISTLCYSYFRVALAFKKEPVEYTMLAGLFLCSNKQNDILSLLRPDWNEQVSLPVIEKLALLNVEASRLFPFGEELAADIEKDAYALSFLEQPGLYARVRPGKKNGVVDKLTKAAIPFEFIKEDCLKLANTTSLENVLKINKDVVIQDTSSQQVFNYLNKVPAYFAGKDKIPVWDSCAASGGKSILLYDILKDNVQLTVSDIRKNILANLEKRLQQAGVPIYRHFVADLEKQSVLGEEELFRVIILDAPCTGSGTWSRTPEQLFYFNKKALNMYAERQKKIASNIVSHLKKDGLFFYITCSVFKKENEEVVAFIKEKFQLHLLQVEYLKGYTSHADTMFVAVFSKSLP